MKKLNLFFSLLFVAAALWNNAWPQPKPKHLLCQTGSIWCAYKPTANNAH